MSPVVVRATFRSLVSVTETLPSFVCVRGTCTKHVCIPGFASSGFATGALACPICVTVRLRNLCS